MPLNNQAKSWPPFQGDYGDNIYFDLHLIELDQERQVPMTQARAHAQTPSYILSPKTAFFHYAKEELIKVKQPVMQLIFKLLIYMTWPLLIIGRFSSVVYGNNRLFSTVLYPKSLQDIPQFQSQFQQKFPQDVIAFRSLNEHTTPQLLNQFKQEGWLLIPTRQVWIFDAQLQDFHKSTNSKHDLKLLKRTPLQLILHHELQESDFVRIRELYQMLYLNKYSQFNPNYSTEYLIYLWQNQLVNFSAFRDEKGIIQAVGGSYELEGVLTNPIVGYNTQLPAQLGLYRLILMYPLKGCFEQDKVFHASAGAPQFKKTRGAQAFIEYSAVSISHLPQRVQLTWKLIAYCLNKWVVPYMKENEL